MVVVGVTGTSGKTTTCYLIAKALEANGAKTGMMTTALFKVADNTWENRTKMTMLGRFQAQKMLRDMVKAGCRYAVVETTSQGIAQYRHEHIAYDIVVLTNLWPEHVEAHGGFENYKRAKKLLFEYTAKLPKKVLEGKAVARIEIVNAQNEHSADFVIDGFDRAVLFGTPPLAAEQIELLPDRSVFKVGDVSITLQLPGAVNIENALAALAVAGAVGIQLGKAATVLSDVPGLPGRYERVDEGQSFRVIVDFAFEPGAMKKLYELVATQSHARIIHILGSCGGGRDAARRPVLGRLAGEGADVVIVTNEDPYDDDPMNIINDVARGAMEAGKREGVDLFRVEDRAEAIRRAIGQAQAGDVVLITGKGSEPVMAVGGGRKIPWSDVAEARKALQARPGASAVAIPAVTDASSTTV